MLDPRSGWRRWFGGSWARVGVPVGIAIAAVALPVTATTASAATPAAGTGPYVSLLIGRGLWAQSEACKAVSGQPTLAQVAQQFAAAGVRATGVTVPARTLETGELCYNSNLYPSWADMAALRDSYGWSFVSNGQKRLDITTLSPAEQYAESCGSLAAFTTHGHTRAWGMYGPGSNRITDSIATNVVGTCFAFTRKYGNTNLNSRAVATSPPYYVKSDDTNGGPCNLATCTGSSGLTKKYMLPTKMTNDLQAAAGTNTWVVLSTYKLVTGSKLTGGRRWDCTSADARAHWTTELESYCLNDILTVLHSIKAGSIVTDPAAVATAWGRVPGSTPPPNAEPNSTVTVPTPRAQVHSPLATSGTATDDHGVARVRLAVRNTVTKLWLQANGTWGANIQLFDATLGSPGATATTWARTFTLPAGSFALSVRAVDDAGVTETTQPWVPFTVT